MGENVKGGANSAMRKLITQKLAGTQPHTNPDIAKTGSIPPGQAELVRQLFPGSPTAAAVLIPIVDRDDGLYVLFTQRAAQMRNHAGQISFPGGRVESDDDGPLSTALRETEEEIGLERRFVSVVGYLEPHLVTSGYSIVPVVGFVSPGFELRLDPSEVAEAFEVPLEHMLNPENHKVRERHAAGIDYRVYDIAYQDRSIWGATAGIVVSLYRLIHEPLSHEVPR